MLSMQIKTDICSNKGQNWVILSSHHFFISFLFMRAKISVPTLAEILADTKTSEKCQKRHFDISVSAETDTKAEYFSWL